MAGVRELPAKIEGGSLARLLARGGEGEVARAREEIVFHFPHYQGAEGPHAAIRLGDLKLIEFYGTGKVALFDLAKDIGEQTDLAARRPRDAAELRQRLRRYLAAVDAQMPKPNPQHDPSKAPAPRERRGGRRGRRRDGDRAPEPLAQPAVEPYAGETPRADAASTDDAAKRIAAAFEPFGDKLKVRWDDDYLYVESDGMPDHRMMVGIRAWNRQVPRPQPSAARTRSASRCVRRSPTVPSTCRSSVRWRSRSTVCRSSTRSSRTAAPTRWPPASSTSSAATRAAPTTTTTTPPRYTCRKRSVRASQSRTPSTATRSTASAISTGSGRRPSTPRVGTTTRRSRVTTTTAAASSRT